MDLNQNSMYTNAMGELAMYVQADLGSLGGVQLDFSKVASQR